MLFPRFIALLFAASPAPLPISPGNPDLAGRAAKIVDPLELTDSARSQRVRDIVVRQYLDLAVIHDDRAARIRAAKAAAGDDKLASRAAIDLISKDVTARLATLHQAYLAKLATELTPTQIDQVKDGMTYGVAPLTFRVYQEMLPDLGDEQKARILAWLVEAREHAMDAGSAKEKHEWFGKYKGRINNYLSAAGIDLKQAEREMNARRKEARPK